MATFAAIPIKFAPKRTKIDFALPAWKNKLGEFTSQDVVSWVNCLYQDKMFPTREEFNAAYDAGRCSWEKTTMVISKEDLDAFEDDYKEGAFEEPGVAKFIEKARKALENEKVVFVY